MFDTLPFRAIRGAFSGFEDGMRGEIDTNEKFSDGYRENDPSKKSAAGQFLSDYSGIRGGARVGEFIGKWGGGLACGLLTGNFIANIAFASIAAGAMAGLWPVLSIGVMGVGAAVIGGSLLGIAGRYAGGFVGAITGGVMGTAVGAYNGIFRRGMYARGKAPEAAEAQQPEAPQPEVPQPEAPQQGQGQAQGVTIPENDPRVEQVLKNTRSHAGEDAVLGANGNVHKPGILSRVSSATAAIGAKMAGAVGLGSGAAAPQNPQNTYEAVRQAQINRSAQETGRGAPAPQGNVQQGNMARALQQVNHGMDAGALRNQAATARSQMKAGAEHPAAGQAASPQPQQSFAERVSRSAPPVTTQSR